MLNKEIRYSTFDTAERATDRHSVAPADHHAIEAGEHAHNSIAVSFNHAGYQPTITAARASHDYFLIPATPSVGNPGNAALLSRLLEVLLVVMVGVALADAFSIRALLLALLLFVVIRPLATMLWLAASPTSRVQRALMGWFGIRGIGSLYYLSYALRHRPGAEVEIVIPIVVTAMALSVLLHGATGQPLLDRYQRTLER
jgi:hypothetical protein